jgi:hypothetical protein
MSAMAAGVGVQVGHWAKYTIFGQEQGIIAMKISIVSISGTTVSGKIDYEYSGGSMQYATFQGDVSQGATFPYVVGANLNEGDYIYYNSYNYPYSYFRVQNVTTRSYAGATRTIVSTTQYGQTYYWDQQTGILVEQTVGTGTVVNYLKLTETNMWSGGIFDPSNPFFWILIVIIVVIAVALALAVLSSLRKKKPVAKTVVPPSQPETAPPPSQPEAKSAEVKYCPKCGTSMPSDSIYCPKCAHKQP